MQKQLPFTKDQLEKIIQTHSTPFHIYNEQALRENARKVNTVFSRLPGFKEFFAVKATPNPSILKILKEERFGVECASLAELLLVEKIGFLGEEILFTSNSPLAEEYETARRLGAIINLDDISHISFLEQHAGLPDLISFRYNPGSLRSGNAIIGNPEDAKFGLTREQLFQAYTLAKNKGIKRFGLHTMIVSNELNPEYFIATARMLFELVVELSKDLDIQFEFVNLGGGIGIPYQPEQDTVDLSVISRGIEKAYQEIIVANNLHPLQIYMENGRMITGPYGYLVTRVLHKKDIYKQYIGVDASMANLMRPGMYGAYHHITIMGKENNPNDYLYDVTGSLCENNDKFAVDRKLPEIEIGDLLVIHDTGAHGHAMGFNYNGKLRSAELLLQESGDVALIRRAETIDDYFATLTFSEQGGIS